MPARERKLKSGDIILGADGALMVVSNEAEQHPGGVTVYNLEVEQAHTYFVLDEDANDAAAVWVHNQCWHESAQARGASRRAQNPGDVTFATQEQALAEALRLHGGSAASPIETMARYGKNPNLRGPNGEPYEVVRFLDEHANLIELEHHSNGHYFADDHTFELPHYQARNGAHISYGASKS